MSSSLESSWLSIEPVVLGLRPPHHPTPDAFLLVDHPLGRFRFDVYYDEIAMPPKAWIWNSIVIATTGSSLSLFDLRTGVTATTPIDAYVAGIYPYADVLFVTTASEIITFDEHLRPLTRHNDLGIDGVIIDKITDELIEGSGEWDPPGGWRPFSVIRTPQDRGGGIA